LNIYPLVNQV